MNALFNRIVVVGAALALLVAPAWATPQSPIQFPDPLPAPIGLPGLTFGYPNTIPGLSVKNEGSPNKEKDLRIDFTQVLPQPLLKIGTVEYKLQNLHFHVHAEHARAGQAYYPMELHFVHKSAEGINVAVGRWVQVQPQDNPDLTDIFRIPAGIPASGISRPLAAFNLGNLLPPADKRQTFRYEGSLTTPHANPPGSMTAVHWIMFNEPLLMSQRQIDKMTDRWPLPVGNWRPLQPLTPAHKLRTDVRQADVPEPGTMMWLTIAGIVLVRRRR